MRRHDGKNIWDVLSSVASEVPGILQQQANIANTNMLQNLDYQMRERDRREKSKHTKFMEKLALMTLEQRQRQHEENMMFEGQKILADKFAWQPDPMDELNQEKKRLEIEKLRREIAEISKSDGKKTGNYNPDNEKAKNAYRKYREGVAEGEYTMPYNEWFAQWNIPNAEIGLPPGDVVSPSSTSTPGAQKININALDALIKQLEQELAGK